MTTGGVKLEERDEYLEALNKWASDTKDRYIENICNTGEGKTTAAVAMMASLYEEDDVLIMSSAEHWKYVNKHTVGALLLDDLFGSMHFDEKQMKEWMPLLPVLNYTEKRMMLSRHVVAGHKVKSEVEKSSKTHTSTLGFPETCSLFVSKDEFMDLGSAFFESPIACALQFIMDYVATDIRIEESRDQIFVMRIQKHNFWLLSELFAHYITYGYVVKIAQHRAFRDLKFLNFFFDFVKKKGMIADLILKVDNTTMDEETTEKRRVGLLYGSVDMDKPNADLAIAILKLGCHVQKRRPWSKEQIDVGLVRAARRGSYQSADIVLHLLNHGASVSSIRAETTALCEAVKSGSIKTVNVLLDAGASIYDRDLNDQTPLHHTCDWNQIEIAKLLVSNGADINTRDTTGLSPFLVAAGWERLELLDFFLARKVNAFTVDEQDNNVLHICAANGRTMAIRKILNILAEEMATCLTARNKYGWTPLDFAMRCGHLGVAKVLVRTILRQDQKKVGHIRTFNHMRFNVMKKEDFNKNEKFSSRFVDLTKDGEYFQVPKCKWFVHAGSKQDYDKVSLFVAKYDDRLRKRYAKS
ncbi:hypothetical protein ACF0H5_023961 [Mactra antiquata]